MFIKKSLFAIVMASLLFSSSLIDTVKASTPYEAYNYNYWEEAVASPAAYVPDKVITGLDLGIGSLLEPNDFALGSDGRKYISDTGNKRIIVVSQDWKVEQIIEGYMSAAGVMTNFENPTGLFVDHDNLLYVADSVLGQVIAFDEQYKVALVIENPQSDIIAAGFKFVPQKLAVDEAKRIYVVASGVFEGIMQFDTDGSFLGYIGTNEVKRDYYEIMWRMFSTKEQLSKSVLFIPTEFSNLDLDQKGFLYATNIDISTQTPIKRLNPSGVDVLKRYGYFDVKGDIFFRSSTGPSRFVDIKYLNDGLYSGLDSNQGKIFTYDAEGNLLYIFGALGNQVGTFRTPVALEFDGENHYVLDRAKANISIFKPTKFGKLVNEASRLHYNGYSKEAVPIWEEVLTLNSNYDVAYIGIGRSLVMAKQNEEAIFYFKQGMEREQYSVAFKRFRREEMKEHFSVVMTIILIGAIVAIGLFMWRKILRKNMKSKNSHAVGRDQAL